MLALALGAMLAAPGARAAGCATSSAPAIAGLAAQATNDGVRVEWQGAAGQALRLDLVAGATPLVRSLAIRQGGWIPVIENAVPEFAVTTGLRRMSNQQLQPLQELGVPIDQTVVDQHRWDAFWDAPLDLGQAAAARRSSANPPPPAGIPGTDQPALPRSPSEIANTTAAFVPLACSAVRTGNQLAIDLAGVQMGAFAGKLRFTVYRGTNLIRMEVLATTQRRWVAYKFSAGLRVQQQAGARIDWRDTAGAWQSSPLGGADNPEGMTIVARNRVAAYGGRAGSLAFFPEPHKLALVHYSDTDSR